MFCRYCGVENDEGSVFCKSCGKRMFAESNNNIEPEEESKLPLIIGIIVAVVVIVLAIIVVVWLLKGKDEDTISEQPSTNVTVNKTQDTSESVKPNTTTEDNKEEPVEDDMEKKIVGAVTAYNNYLESDFISETGEEVQAIVILDINNDGLPECYAKGDQMDVLLTYNNENIVEIMSARYGSYKINDDESILWVTSIFDRGAYSESFFELKGDFNELHGMAVTMFGDETEYMIDGQDATQTEVNQLMNQYGQFTDLFEKYDVQEYIDVDEEPTKSIVEAYERYSGKKIYLW